MFGFGKKKPSPSPPVPPTAPHPVSAPPQGVFHFGVRTRIAKAVGKDDKYRCGSVRALPSVHPNEVVLQATDGHQACCTLTHGQMSRAMLVPPAVLPTRQMTKPIGIRLMGSQWESLDGKIVPHREEAGERALPKLGDVLPVVNKTPFHETPAQAQRRRESDPSPSMHIVMGVDLDLLRKTAEALGTTKLTLLIPVPVKDVNKKPSETFVDKPIAVCPANKEADCRGIAVVMPLQPENGTGYYAKVRETVIASEQRALNPVKSQARRAG